MKKPKQTRYEQAALVLARALYPTPMGEDSIKLDAPTALRHVEAGIRALRNAGFIIVRSRQGADTQRED